MNQACFAAGLQRMPYARYLGISYAEESGIFTLGFRPDLVGNPRLPAVHGGALGGFMESVALLYLGGTETLGRVPKPVDFSIDFLRSAAARDSFARCEVLRQGRRVAQAQVQCWQQDASVLIAVGRGHFILEEPAPQARQA